MTPLKWLHMTTLIAGSTDEINRSQMATMVSEAQDLLCEVDAISVSLEKIFYHPEAIGLLARPVESLRQIFDVALAVTSRTIRQAGLSYAATSLWNPHMTVSYSTAEQPAEPIIESLGVAIPERQVLVDSLTLVIQWGPERVWNWEPVGTAYLRSNGKGKHSRA
ncbi:MAG TPA: 2'-5' RNA ligase family protein [Pseudonocardiaceae bacterium]|nr:2'-5' RNA ligase family protein [Pseudonocardiaceae bacterium]